MIIRKANKKDTLKILHLLNSDANLTCDNQLNYNQYHVKEHVFGKNFITFIWEEDKELLGVIIINLFRIGKYAELYNLAVEQKHRRKKIGTKLISFVENYLKNKKYNLIYLYAEEKNKPMKELSLNKKYKKGKTMIFFSKMLK